jgi:hypothetical protein
MLVRSTIMHLLLSIISTSPNASVNYGSGFTSTMLYEGDLD